MVQFSATTRNHLNTSLPVHKKKNNLIYPPTYDERGNPRKTSRFHVVKLTQRNCRFRDESASPPLGTSSLFYLNKRVRRCVSRQAGSRTHCPYQVALSLSGSTFQLRIRRSDMYLAAPNPVWILQICSLTASLGALPLPLYIVYIAGRMLT